MTAGLCPAWLLDLRSAGVRLGLDRVDAALRALGRPQAATPAILVGGTNGKGSVAASLDAILRAAGHRTALYTSPHLLHVGERMRVGGEPVGQSEFDIHAAAVRGAVLRHELTYFEALTVIAFHFFADREVDVAVLEVGLGGRLDATNVVDPLLSVVTSVAIDHVRELGGTIERIAAEKAGIFRSGVPALSAAEGLAADVLAAEGARRGADVHRLERCGRISAIRIDRSGTRFAVESGAWGGLLIRTPLLGRHQARNAWTAIEAAALLPSRLRPDVPTVVRGVETVRWPGRMDLRAEGDRHVLFDVAHNPAGIETLVESMGAIDLPSPRIAVVGICSDKPWAAMLRALMDSVDACILTTPPSMPAERRWHPRTVARTIRGHGEVSVVPEFDAALDRASVLGSNGTVVICGSVFTVGDAMRRMADLASTAPGLPA